jgi:SAM-dependent methyltransferase
LAGDEPTPAELSDADTVAYFDDHVPDYSPERLETAAAFIREHAPPGASLIDLGCGVGNTLAYLDTETPIEDFVALDVSAKCLDQTRALVTCEPVLGSVLDPAIASRFAGRFDFAILSAVLHHLVGKTRAESRANAVVAVRNGLMMLREGGALIIQEPVFGPRPAMDAVFWVKRGLSRISGNRRIPVLGYWGNLGAPVVSYYSDEGLMAIISEAGGEPVRHLKEGHRLEGIMGRLLDRSDVTVAVSASPLRTPARAGET